MTEPRKIIHVDMDAFYASVEQLDKPGLAGKPVIVGGQPGSRGVVAAASYEVRKFGVHSAMPMARAVRLCPDAIVLPVRMERYVEVSRHIHKIFSEYTPLVESLSLDEAFLDVTASTRLFGNAEKIGRQIQDSIRQDLGLSASVGIAPNKFLAKLASDLRKPAGFVVITEDNKQQILDPLPVSKIWGVGKVTEQALNEAGIMTIGQLRRASIERLATVLGNQVPHILRLAQGIDNRPVEPNSQARSISSEQTFATDIDDKEILADVLLSQVEEVCFRLRKEGLEARTVTLKLRYGDFKTVTKSRTIDEEATNTTEILWQQALEVFLEWYEKSAAPLRLLGFEVSQLRKQGSGQQQLFTDTHQQKQKHLDSVLDEIRDKFGEDSIKRGRQKK